jgi:hypothetical protein
MLVDAGDFLSFCLQLFVAVLEDFQRCFFHGAIIFSRWLLVNHYEAVTRNA